MALSLCFIEEIKPRYDDIVVLLFSLRPVFAFQDWNYRFAVHLPGIHVGAEI